MRYSFIGLFVLLCSFVSSAQGILRGTVISNSQKPVAYALVQLDGTKLEAFTDSSGYFIIENIKPGNYDVSISAIGFQAKKENRTINEGYNTIQLEIESITLHDILLIRRYEFQPIEITAYTTATSSNPFSFSNLNQTQINKMNNGQDLPYLLTQTPSLVATSDAGNGIGYTGLWIRGSDPSRINVTINDVPLNDPESQQVFWVNTPDLASNTNSIQVQRGIGNSTNGPGAFGGSIKMNTQGLSSKPFFSTEHTFGSFGTMRNNVNFGSGVLYDHFYLEGRLSSIQSDGYIDRGAANLKSYYLDAAYKNNKTSIQLTTFSGREITYQSWYGTPAEKLEGGDLNAFADRNGLSDAERQNLLNSGRTYNYYTYNNQVDNYNQTHYQLHLNHQINDRWKIRATGHYTKGKGYFEEFKENDDLSDYALSPYLLGRDTTWSDGNTLSSSEFINQYNDPNAIYIFDPLIDALGDTFTDGNGNIALAGNASVYTSDIIRRRWLDNDFFGGIASATYTSSKLNLRSSLSWNEYKGRHFGELIWLQYSPGSFSGDRYYEGNSNKKDINFYTNADYAIGNFHLFADVQVRNVIYVTKGVDNDLRPYDVEDNLLFINPKAGINYFLRGFRYYASISIGNKEPNRNDYVDAYVGSKPKSEQMIDYELGFQSSQTRFSYGGNLYYMDYTNQLVLTGALNDVGAPLRANVADSYRAGIELNAGWQIVRDLTLKGNLTLSQNKIKQFNEIIYDYSISYEEKNIEHNNTTIAFSPSVIANGTLDYVIYDDLRNMNSKGNKLTISLLGRYVGKQYLDNTQNEELTIPAYGVVDSKLTYERTPNGKPHISLSLWVNNTLNHEYSSNGYTFSYIFGERVSERFYYPQAGRNYLASVKLSF